MEHAIAEEHFPIQDEVRVDFGAADDGGDKEWVRGPAAEQRAPYWLPRVLRPTDVSICFADSGTISSLASR